MAVIVPGGYQVLPTQLSSAGSQMAKVAQDMDNIYAGVDAAPTNVGDPTLDGPLGDFVHAASTALAAALGTTNAAGNQLSLAGEYYAGTNTNVSSQLAMHGGHRMS